VGDDEEEDQFWVYATGGSSGQATAYGKYGGNEKYLGVLRDGKFTPAVGLDYQPMKGKLDV
jgi:hypothetical protein